MLREREERKERDEEIYQARKAKEAEEERLEKLKEAEELKIKEEKERIEQEEYLKLKDQFTVEEEGQDREESDLDSEGMLMKFVDFIKNSKTVVLEDLAAEFKIQTKVNKAL
jgi:DDRGK domain-containing protein 1